mgnify:CR=1 FL=1
MYADYIEHQAEMKTALSLPNHIDVLTFNRIDFEKTFGNAEENHQQSA